MDESMVEMVLKRVVMVVSSVELMASQTTLAASARSTSWKQKFSPGSSSLEYRQLSAQLSWGFDAGRLS